MWRCKARFAASIGAVHQLVTAAAAHQVGTTAVEQAAALLDRMRYLIAAAAD
jgi:hypothetical protein